MIITVDTGNKMIKTETLEFHAGVEILDQIPGEQEEVILYGGKYYRPTSRRISYMEDKTEDDRYFILTLFAIAKELQTIKTENLISNGLIEIELLVGLPPAHYGKQRRAYREYFYREGSIVDFSYMNRPYKIAFTDVRVYIQAYAAYCLVAVQRQLFSYPKVLVIDIGGFTVDYMIRACSKNLVKKIKSGKTISVLAQKEISKVTLPAMPLWSAYARGILFQRFLCMI